MELNKVTNVSELFIKFMPDTNMNDAQKLYTTIGFQSRLQNVIKSNKRFGCIYKKKQLFNNLIILITNKIYIYCFSVFQIVMHIARE